MTDERKPRIVPPAKVHGDSGVTSVSADSIVTNDGEGGSTLPADPAEKGMDETLASGLKFPEGA
jgi:hypothetical protein